VLGVASLPCPLPGIRTLVVPCVNEEISGTVHAHPTFLHDYARGLLRLDGVDYSSHYGWDRALLDELGIPGTYLPNAVPGIVPAGDLRAELGIAPEMPLIVHVANLWPEKNHVGFLEELREARGDWRLACIGGPSPHHPAIAAAVDHAAALDPRVRLLGPRSRAQVAGALEAADLLVLPSLAEATPLVLLEAMSHGLPWIASDTCGSAPDLAGGTIVAQGAFAAEIARLLDDAPARAALGAAGRRAYAAEYSWDAVAPRYLDALGLPPLAVAA
jgi:glycosyltransferase involved in cell wall biosynthesis